MATTTMSIPTWLPILFFVAIFFLLSVPSTSAGPCTGPDYIAIAFPEVEPGKPFDKYNPEYIQKVADGSEKQFMLEVSNDPDFVSPFDFKDKFKVFVTDKGGFVQMIAGIDRDGQTHDLDDDTNVLEYSLKCVPAGSGARYKVLKIQIVDSNDNAPRFEHPSLHITVNELTPVGLTVYRGISAVDKDSGINKEVSYSLSRAFDAQFDGSDSFSINANGDLTVVKALDFEPMYHQARADKNAVLYKMLVTAQDAGVPPMSSTMSLVVKILDNDDLDPTFDYPSCVQGGRQSAEHCVRAAYTTHVNIDNKLGAALVLMPHPADPSSPQKPVDMIMYDRDTLDFRVTCSILRTLPFGYESYFQTFTEQVAISKRYRCTIKQMKTIPSSKLSSLELIIEATESSTNSRRAYASVAASFD